MNPYASVINTLRARNMFEGTISPPNDFTIGGTNWETQILNVRRNLVSPNGNFFIRSMGLFCNFADGLVLSGAAMQMTALFRASARNRTTPSVAATWSATSKTITCVSAGFAINDRVILMSDGTPGHVNTQYGIVKTIPDAASLTLSDYPLANNGGNATITKLTSATAVETGTVRLDARELNLLYAREVFFSPVLLTSSPTTELLIEVQATTVNMTWYTKSINTSFDGDNIFWDVQSDVEYTARTATEKAA